jgi:hypothetical protein
MHPMPVLSEFSLVDGGPLYASLKRLGWTRADGRVDFVRASLMLVAIAWGPLLVAAVSAHLMTDQSFAIEWGIHTRLLVAIPLLLCADVSLHARTRSVVAKFAADRCAPGQTDELDRIVAGTLKLRDAVYPEVAMLVAAVVASQLVTWHVGGLGARRVTASHPIVAARWWYAVVALPMFQFLVFRALWRWGIWTRMLWKLSRLRLAPVATHPDLAGGLEFLSWPSIGFGYVVAALSATQAGVWADQVLRTGVNVMDLKGYAIAFVIAWLVVALGPLFLVAGHLWRCRYQGLYDYSALASDYTRLFQERWIAQRPLDDLLGSADIQSLADLANSYNVVDKMRFWPFGLRTVITVALAAVLPMLPLALLEGSLPELLIKLAGAMLGKTG